MDNLESQTYEVFEKDPVKYAEYEKVHYSQFLANHLMLSISNTYNIEFLNFFENKEDLWKTEILF